MSRLTNPGICGGSIPIHALSVTEDYHASSITITHMIDQLGWRTLQQRRQIAKVTMTYQIIYGLLEMDISFLRKISTRHLTATFPLLSTVTGSHQHSFFLD